MNHMKRKHPCTDIIKSKNYLPFFKNNLYCNKCINNSTTEYISNGMYLFLYPDQSFLKDGNKYGCEFMRNVKTIFLKRSSYGTWDVLSITITLSFTNKLKWYHFKISDIYLQLLHFRTNRDRSIFFQPRKPWS